MKTWVKNRDNNDLCIVTESHGSDTSRLAFVMHGLGGNKSEPHIRSMTEVLISNGYTVVTWDAVHTFGESRGGLYEDATVTNYYADLEDVINWASTQDWYIEPFLLCGHSLGGIATTLYAEAHPERVRALAPISTAVSGELLRESWADDIADWQTTGIRTKKRSSGGTKSLRWSFMEDSLRYDIIPDAQKLTMSKLLVVGSHDTTTTPEHQKLLYDALPPDKEIHVIDGAEHSFYQAHERSELAQMFDMWLKTKVL